MIHVFMFPVSSHTRGLQAAQPQAPKPAIGVARPCCNGVGAVQLAEREGEVVRKEAGVASSQKVLAESSCREAAVRAAEQSLEQRQAALQRAEAAIEQSRRSELHAACRPCHLLQARLNLLLSTYLASVMWPVLSIGLSGRYPGRLVDVSSTMVCVAVAVCFQLVGCWGCQIIVPQ
jgi:nitrate reductase NapE component